MDLSVSLKERLTWKTMHKYTLQALKSRNIRFWWIINKFDFTKNIDKPCVYKKVSGGGVIFLILYVDDILVLRNDISLL